MCRGSLYLTGSVGLFCSSCGTDYAIRDGIPILLRKPRLILDPRIRYFYRTWYRTPYLVPNWNIADICVALKRLLLPLRSSAQSSNDELKKILKEKLGCEHVVLTSSGRTAIELALRNLNLPSGEVILPTFVCGTVAQAVIDAGHIPVLADVNDDLTLSCESVERRLTQKTIAVIIAHLSGKPAQDLEPIVTLCRQKRIALIDDAAQSVGIKYRGRYLGTFGDFGVFSFGIGKPTFSIGGGALILSSEEKQRRCDEILKKLPNFQPNPFREQLSVLNFILEYSFRRLTQPIYLAKRFIIKTSGLRRSRSLKRIPISELEAHLQLRQIRKLDQTLEKYRTNAVSVMDGLYNRDDIQFPQRSENSGYTKLLALLPEGRITGFLTHLLKSGIEIERSYVPLELRQKFRLGSYHNLNARRLWHRVVALPNHPGLEGGDMDYLVKSIQRFGEYG